jgi:hypothetical protein
LLHTKAGDELAGGMALYRARDVIVRFAFIERTFNVAGTSCAMAHASNGGGGREVRRESRERDSMARKSDAFEDASHRT